MFSWGTVFQNLYNCSCSLGGTDPSIGSIFLSGMVIPEQQSVQELSISSVVFKLFFTRSRIFFLEEYMSSSLLRGVCCSRSVAWVACGGSRVVRPESKGVVTPGKVFFGRSDWVQNTNYLTNYPSCAVFSWTGSRSNLLRDYVVCKGKLWVESHGRLKERHSMPADPSVWYISATFLACWSISLMYFNNIPRLLIPQFYVFQQHAMPADPSVLCISTSVTVSTNTTDVLYWVLFFFFFLFLIRRLQSQSATVCTAGAATPTICATLPTSCAAPVRWASSPHLLGMAWRCFTCLPL